jgi:hypothetical protein
MPLTMGALVLAGLVGCGSEASSSGPAADAAVGDGPDDAWTDAGSLLDTGAEGGPLTCAQISVAATSRLAAAFDIARDLSCQVDGDCVVAWTFSECTFTCWSLVNQRGAAAITAALDEVNRDVCPAFKAAACPAIRPPCVPPPPATACVAGACTVRYP